jgi:SAM-dependent methyltransferase
VTPHPFTGYWNRGVRNVPDMTGARHLMDVRDLKAIMAALGLALPLTNVLDVGCGTGRLGQIAENYMGVDIAPDAVAYAAAEGYNAHVINGVDDLRDLVPMFQTLTCISVFTHIDRPERQAYLKAFHRLSPRVIVDIIPGDGSGDVELWTAKPEEFAWDCRAAGFTVVREHDEAWDRNTHRYFLLERRGLTDGDAQGLHE